jgi:lipoprotein-anchoring transpeptidase ErfK/SrfK
MRRKSAHTWLGLAVIGAAAAACKKPPADASFGSSASDASVTSAPVVAVGPAATSAPPPPANAPKVAALATPTPICSAMEWPPRDPSKASDERLGVIRLGYLRKGQAVAVKNAEPTKKPNCPEGWWELVEGGFVCGKYATADFNHKELAKAPHAPFSDRPLPYEYGMNLTNGTPLYRRVPYRKERAQFEKGLAVGKAKSADEVKAEARAEMGGGGDTPWYLKSFGGQKPTVSFDELKGEVGLIEQRMVRGFYLALDTKESAYAGKFWRTTRGSYVPADHILVHKSVTEFEGVRLDAPNQTLKLPIAFVLGLHAHKYSLSDDKQRAKRGDKLERFTVVGLTGQKKIVDDETYWETTDGWLLRAVESTRTNPGPAPKDLAPGEKWIDVNIAAETLVAFTGDKPAYATLVSSGRSNKEDPAKNYKTKTGAFRIREKHIATTMDDDAASDGTYRIEDVPWVMYFDGSLALHGAFWHSSFGHERSHGCVNLTPFDAKNLFGWVGPRLPDGWHGVRATEANPGTRVIVHE